ncbi:MAG TPA: hypothetical protein PLJ29_02985 [Leptospiraceae bacterium]|nr:hypothetical protein [Leptospiraceae bacterium]
MAEVKGKFITLSCTLLETKPKAKQEALQKVKEMTGKEFDELDPEGWYDTKVFQAVFNSIEANTSVLLAKAAIKLIGQKVYPTIEKTAGLPLHLKTPLDFIKFEAEGFLQNHRGADVQPRKIIAAVDGNVVIQANSPGYSPLLIEGVFLGILEMCGIRTGKVDMKEEDGNCVYYITWQPI